MVFFVFKYLLHIYLKHSDFWHPHLVPKCVDEAQIACNRVEDHLMDNHAKSIQYFRSKLTTFCSSYRNTTINNLPAFLWIYLAIWIKSIQKLGFGRKSDKQKDSNPIPETSNSEALWNFSSFREFTKITYSHIFYAIHFSFTSIGHCKGPYQLMIPVVNPESNSTKLKNVLVCIICSPICICE